MRVSEKFLLYIAKKADATASIVYLILNKRENGIITSFDLTNYFKISNSTLHSHLQSIFLKRGVNSKAELIYNFYQKQTSQNAI